MINDAIWLLPAFGSPAGEGKATLPGQLEVRAVTAPHEFLNLPAQPSLLRSRR